MTPEIRQRIEILRQKSADNTITLDEMREAVVLMREGRKAAATSASVSRTKKAKAEIKSADEMLDELGSI
jgi:hypothetical protein